MMFTRLGSIVAILALAGGILHVAGGLMIATGVVGPPQEALAHFFPNKKQQVRLSTGAYMRSSLASHLVF